MKHLINGGLVAIVLLVSLVAPAAAQLSQMEEQEASAIAADVSGDHKTAIQLYQSLAEQGYAVAQFSLGDIYDKGRGVPQRFKDEEVVPQDYIQAYMWYELAAKNKKTSQKTMESEIKFRTNVVNARDQLAAKMTADQLDLAQRIVRDWKPVSSSQKQATEIANQAIKETRREWEKQAIRDERAAEERGDRATARQITMQLAKVGNKIAQFNMGVMYLHGVGFQPDDKQAAEWFRKSADQGYGQASLMLSNLYSLGRGLPQSYQEGKKWARKAADQGADVPLSLLGSRDYPCPGCSPERYEKSDRELREWQDHFRQERDEDDARRVQVITQMRQQQQIDAFERHQQQQQQNAEQQQREQRDEQVNQQQVTQQQMDQMRMDQQQADESRRLHDEFNKPISQQPSQPDIQYVPGLRDPNPPPNVTR